MTHYILLSVANTFEGGKPADTQVWQAFLSKVASIGTPIEASHILSESCWLFPRESAVEAFARVLVVAKGFHLACTVKFLAEE